MSSGWFLLVPKLMTCFQKLGNALGGRQCTQQVEGDQVEIEEETVVVLPLVEKGACGVLEDTRQVETRARGLVVVQCWGLSPLGMFTVQTSLI